MSMVVKNNIPAQLTLGQLNKNISEAGKLLGKISSGQKINSAKDDAANYAISEKMREQIRSLTQDNQNVQNGNSLFKIANGGIEEIVEELRNLKELAINSANDTNTDVDRATMQKELQQKMANINDIATTTNYNGIPLLDGTWSKKYTPEGYTTQTYSYEVQIEEIVGYSEVTTTQITGGPTRLTAGDWELEESGVYILASDFTGNIFINDGLTPDVNGVTGIKIIQESPAALNDVYITGPSGGNANLWIENLNINNSQGKNFINFKGDNNCLNFKGVNYLNKPGNGLAAIHVGGGTTIVEGGTDGSGVINYGGRGDHYGALIGTNQGENLASSNIQINSGTYNNSAFVVGTAFIGSAINGTIGDITVASGTFTDNYNGKSNDALIGGGGNVGDITIDHANLTAMYKVWDPIVGTTNGAKTVMGNINITNSEIHYAGINTAAQFSSVAIGCSSYEMANSTCQDITIDNCILDIYVSGGNVGIGAGKNCSVNGNITITNTDLSNVIGGKKISKNDNDTTVYSTDTGVANITPLATIPHSGNEEPSAEYQTTTTTELRAITELRSETRTETVELYTPGSYRYDPLTIHHGPKANQATKFYINDMHTKSLGTDKLVSGTDFEKESDEDRYWALAYDRKKQSDYLDTIYQAQNKSLDDINVKTRKDANVAIRVLDGAIEVALDEATKIGSYLQRLDYTSSNLVTMNENVQSSESTIRDADMAKEMANYTKANVLTQASQSMLAQANQSSSSVLSLLQ